METYYTSKYQGVEKLIQKRLKPLGMASNASGLGRRQGNKSTK